MIVDTTIRTQELSNSLSLSHQLVQLNLEACSEKKYDPGTYT